MKNILNINDQKIDSNPLVVVLSCNKNKHLWSKIIEKNIDNLIIFCGDPQLKSNYLYKNKILYLKCDDTYDHLPTKIYMMIKAILDIFKIDDHDTKFQMNIIDKIKSVITKNMDYSGQRVFKQCKKKNTFQGNNKYHYNKCPKSSIWYNMPYLGDYVPWCDGGCGYILSRKSMKLIKYSLSNKEIYKNHIYEDLMIGIVLHQHNIDTIKINNIIIVDK